MLFINKDSTGSDLITFKFMKRFFSLLFFLTPIKLTFARKDFFSDDDVFILLILVLALVINYILCFILAFLAMHRQSKPMSVVALLLSLIYLVPLIFMIGSALLRPLHGFDAMSFFSFILFALIMVFPFIYALDKVRRVYGLKD